MTARTNNKKQTCRGGPADAHFIALVGGEVVEDEPCCGSLGICSRWKLGGELGPEGEVRWCQGVEAEVGEGWVGAGDGDGFGAEEDGLFCVGEGRGEEEEEGEEGRHLGGLPAARSLRGYGVMWQAVRVRPKMDPDSGPVPGGWDRRWPLMHSNEIGMMHCVT